MRRLAGRVAAPASRSRWLMGAIAAALVAATATAGRTVRRWMATAEVPPG